MRVVTNEAYVKRRALIGSLGTAAGFVVLLVGMYESLQMPAHPAQYFIPWIALAFGIVLLNVGKYHALRYGTRPRIDQALTQALKGLDSRCQLFNFVPDLPVEHLLVTPNALVILETRPFFGEVIHEGSRWTRPWNPQGIFQRFSEGGLGNPTTEAKRSADAVQKLLHERMDGEQADAIVVLPVIVMSNPRLKLRLDNPEVPVVLLNDLRGAIRKIEDGQKMRPDVLRQLGQVLQWEPPEEDTPKPTPKKKSKKKELSTTRRGTWQRTQKISNR